MVDYGFFCFIIFYEFGGENVFIFEIVEVFEVICVIDGLVGWNVMLGFEINVMVVGGMDEMLVKEIYFDNLWVVMCGGGGVVVEFLWVEE